MKKYRKKTCPVCGTEHQKRGLYCSRSCGNKKSHSAETKEKISEIKKEWHATSDTAAVVAHNYVGKRTGATPDPIAPIVRRDNLESNQFVSDGDIWEIAN